MSLPFNVVAMSGLPKDMLLCVSVKQRAGESWIDTLCRAADEGRLAVIKDLGEPPPEPAHDAD